MRKLTPMQIYMLLPKTNCGECGFPTCLAFAFNVASGKANVFACPYLSDEAKRKLSEALAPPIKLVTIGVGSEAVKIGGERVIHRHEDKFYNPTAIAFAISDLLSEEELRKQIAAIENTKLERLEEILKPDLIALKGSSENPERFAKAVETILETTSLPIILCSFNPKVMEEGLKLCGSKRPLIYAATKDNLESMAKLAIEYDCPLAIYEPGRLESLAELVKKARNMGVKDLVLDVGFNDLRETLEKLVLLRHLAIGEEKREYGYPTITFPSLATTESDALADFWEVTVATSFMIRYASIIVLNSIKPWRILPLLILRQGIFRDPRIHPRVKPGLYAIGNVNEHSPCLVTSNYALTYFTVKSDIEASKVPSYLLVVDTGGLSVASAFAGGKFTAEKIAEAIEEHKIKEKVKHRTIIIPGLTAKISGKLEELTNWKVIVGPRDSSELRVFLRKISTT
ncbi:MAG: acetyl-CoA decarbonylase/synthase complex subunit gamma [Thermoprotei archaeon]|nr:MAG: acetyl-CoA decarbonylase/synthase complex subunit gamma [Thermoprotei archaeon]